MSAMRKLLLTFRMFLGAVTRPVPQSVYSLGPDRVFNGVDPVPHHMHGVLVEPGT